MRKARCGKLRRRTCRSGGLLLAVSAACAGAANAAPPFPQPFEAVYEARRDGLVLGETVRSLRRNDQDLYVYRSRTRSKGWLSWLVRIDIEQRSQWRWQDEWLHSLRYDYDRHAPKAKHMTLTFDWAQRRLHRVTRDRDQQTMAIPLRTIDKHLLPLAVVRDLNFGVTDLQYTVADGHQIKNYAFEIVAEELLVVPAGKFKTVRLRRIGSKSLEIWAAPRIHYLPVRLRGRKDDDDAEIQLTLKTIRFSESPAADTNPPEHPLNPDGAVAAAAEKRPP